MKKYLILLIVPLIGCSTNQWYSYNTNASVSKDELGVAKSVCNYDMQEDEMKENLRKSMSVSRYESSGSKKEDKFHEKAKSIRNDLVDCMKENGLYLKK